MYYLEKIKLKLAKKIGKILKKEIGPEKIIYPPNIELGDLCFPCFGYDKNPKELAEKLFNKLKLPQNVKEIKIVGPYLNFILDEKFLAHAVLREASRKKYGANLSGAKKRIMVEFANQNTHKEVHIGHLRNMIYGNAILRLLKINGYESIPVSYINDFGIHTAKTLWYLKNFFNEKKIITLSDEKKGVLLGNLYTLASIKLEENEKFKREVSYFMSIIEKRQGEIYDLWRKTRE